VHKRLKVKECFAKAKEDIKGGKEKRARVNARLSVEPKIEDRYIGRIGVCTAACIEPPPDAPPVCPCTPTLTLTPTLALALTPTLYRRVLLWYLIAPLLRALRPSAATAGRPSGLAWGVQCVYTTYL